MTATLYHQVWIAAPVARVYEALGQWWAPHTSTETADGLVLAHSPGEQHGDVRRLAGSVAQPRGGIRSS